MLIQIQENFSVNPHEITTITSCTLREAEHFHDKTYPSDDEDTYKGTHIVLKGGSWRWITKSYEEVSEILQKNDILFL